MQHMESLDDKNNSLFKCQTIRFSWSQDPYFCPEFTFTMSRKEVPDYIQIQRMLPEKFNIGAMVLSF